MMIYEIDDQSKKAVGDWLWSDMSLLLAARDKAWGYWTSFGFARDLEMVRACQVSLDWWPANDLERGMI